MNCLLEPAGVPDLMDFMLLGEDDPSADAWPTLGLASFAPVGATSAPVPISAPASRRAFSGELLDSVESTTTLLSASLRDSGAAPAHDGNMRFVPVSVSAPAHPQHYMLQHRTQYAGQYASFNAAENHAGLLGSYSVAAPPQQPLHASFEPARQQPSPTGTRQPAPAAETFWGGEQQPSAPDQSSHQPVWDVLPAPAPHPVTTTGSFNLKCSYGTQFGAPKPIPSAVRVADDRMSRAMSQEALQLGGFGGHSLGSTALAAVAEGESLSEGSDADTLNEHHPHFAATATRRGLPASHSSPSLLTLERSASSRRPGGHHASPRAGSGTASPRSISLKIKAARARPAGAARTAAAGVAGAPRAARFAARRSMVLSAEVTADEEPACSDSDAELENSLVAEERRSGGAAVGASQQTAAAGAACGKKKHNPWSLTETEALVEGVRLLGPSKWAEIKKLAVGGIAGVLALRSAVDLKDKWRNLTRVAKLPKSVLKARAHKSTSDIPLDLLLAVKDLMEMSRD